MKIDSRLKASEKILTQWRHFELGIIHTGYRGHFSNRRGTNGFRIKNQQIRGSFN